MEKKETQMLLTTIRMFVENVADTASLQCATVASCESRQSVFATFLMMAKSLTIVLAIIASSVVLSVVCKYKLFRD